MTATDLGPADLEATLLSLWSTEGGHTNPYPIYDGCARPPRCISTRTWARIS